MKIDKNAFIILGIIIKIKNDRILEFQGTLQIY